MITRTDIAAHLEKSARTGFLAGQKTYTPMRSPFCRDVPSDGAFEVYADMGAAPWPVANAGKAGAAGTDGRTNVPANGQVTAGNQVTVIGGEEKGLVIYNRDFETVIGITHNAIDDDRAGDLEAWANAAGVRFQQHMDYMAFNAINTGEATTFIGKCHDGLSLFNDSHVDPGALYQTTQDNKYALALSVANFSTVRIAGSKFVDSRGQPTGLRHNLLIYPPDLIDAAMQIIRNPQKGGQANLDVNPYAGLITGLEAPGGWLDASCWALVDATLPQKPLNLQVRKQPELTIWDDENTGDGGVRYFKFHARYEIFPGDWRLIIEGNT